MSHFTANERRFYLQEEESVTSLPPLVTASAAAACDAAVVLDTQSIRSKSRDIGIND